MDAMNGKVLSWEEIVAMPVKEVEVKETYTEKWLKILKLGTRNEEKWITPDPWFVDNFGKDHIRMFAHHFNTWDGYFFPFFEIVTEKTKSNPEGYQYPK